MLSVHMAPSRRAHWHLAEKPMLLRQQLRGERTGANSTGGDEGPNKPWQPSPCWVRLYSVATVSIFSLL